MNQLSDYKKILENSGLIAQILPPEEANGAEVLLVQVGSMDHTEENPDDREWQLEISFINMFEEELQESLLLQFFVCLHPNTPVETATTIYEVLGNFNTQVPVGSFGYMESQNLLFYRHSQIISNKVNFEENLSELIWLIVLVLSRYSEVPLAAASGHYKAKDLLEKIGLK